MRNLIAVSCLSIVVSWAIIGCTETGSATDPSPGAAAWAMADTTEFDGYSLLSGDTIVFQHPGGTAGNCFLDSTSSPNLSWVGDTGQPYEDTAIYRLLHDTLLMEHPSWDTGDLMPSREMAVAWQRWTRVRGMGLPAIWIPIQDSVETLGVYDTRTGLIAGISTSAVSMLWPAPGKDLAFSQFELTATTATYTEQYPRGWAAWWATIMRERFAYFDTGLIVAIRPVGYDKVEYTGGRDGEVVVEQRLPGGGHLYTSSDSSHHPYTWFDRPTDISQCTDETWFSSFLSENSPAVSAAGRSIRLARPWSSRIGTPRALRLRTTP